MPDAEVALLRARAKCMEDDIVREIGWGNKQSDIASMYARLIALGPESEVSWTRINYAITAYWTGKSALKRIKEMAWKRM